MFFKIYIQNKVTQEKKNQFLEQELLKERQNVNSYYSFQIIKIQSHTI